MNKNNVYDSLINDPHMNIAFERQLTTMHTDNVTLFLWQNDKCVVIGRNQNALVECNLEYLKENNIALSRRYSGGGAVFHDMGNINYTLVMKEKVYDIEYAKKYIFDALQSIGFNVDFTGRNDITIDGAKFSGQAYFFHKNMHVLHGTLMFDLNISELGHCLTPSKKKLESKGIKSVKSRVMNLKEINPDVTVEQIKDALVNSFNKFYGESNELIHVEESMVDQELTTYLKSEDWLYGQSPAFDITMEKRFDFGNVLLHLTIKSNKVKEVKVYTDSLSTEWLPLEDIIKGSNYNEDEIWDLVLNYSR